MQATATNCPVCWTAALHRWPRARRNGLPVANYWWNDHAVILFGPVAGADPAPWRRKLEETRNLAVASSASFGPPAFPLDG